MNTKKEKILKGGGLNYAVGWSRGKNPINLEGKALAEISTNASKEAALSSTNFRDATLAHLTRYSSIYDELSAGMYLASSEAS